VRLRADETELAASHPNAASPKKPGARQLAPEFDRRWERARELTEVRAIGI